MPSVKEQLVLELRKFRAAGREPATLDLGEKAFAALCEEMGTQTPVIEGVPVRGLDRRASFIELGVSYAFRRWHVRMSSEDVASLMKAVPTDELMSLLCIVISQHLDDEGFEDPADEMSADEHDAMVKMIKEAGLDDPSL